MDGTRGGSGQFAERLADLQADPVFRIGGEGGGAALAEAPGESGIGEHFELPLRFEPVMYPGTLRAAVRAELDKDFVKLPIYQIEKHLTGG